LVEDYGVVEEVVDEGRVLYEEWDNEALGVEETESLQTVIANAVRKAQGEWRGVHGEKKNGN